MIGLQRWPKVKQLREKLNAKAKAEPGFRFYLLYDKVYRKDFLDAAYAPCRSNGGAPGVDGQAFGDIEAYGRERFLTELADELKELRHKPGPVRRVLIPKEGQPGKFRPLGLPNIKDRVVQQAVKLLLEPIFEADFTAEERAEVQGDSPSTDRLRPGLERGSDGGGSGQCGHSRVLELLQLGHQQWPALAVEPVCVGAHENLGLA